MIDFSVVKAITIPEGVVMKIVSAGVTLWELATDTIKNWVKYSTEADGKTIYNGGLGYKDGYRIRSGGAEQAQTGARHTGFIPVKAGDIVRFYGWNFSYASAANAVNFSDGTFTNLGQFTTQPASYGICSGNAPSVTKVNDIYQFTVPNNTNIQYMRVTGYHSYNVLPPDMIVTINEEIV